MSKARRDLFYKIALFSSQNFSELKTPIYFGPEFLMAVAYTGQKEEPLLFSFSELSVLERANSDLKSQKLHKMLDELEAKIPAEAKIKIFLTNQFEFKEFKHQEHRFVLIPALSTPEDLKKAEEQAFQIFNEKLKHLRWEHPQIPFSSWNVEEHLAALKKNLSLSRLYNLENEEIKADWQELTRKKKMLLHICCGPDAAGVIQQLKDDYELLCFWYDPNIQPKSEYDLRLEAFIKVAEKENVPYIIGEYDVRNFLDKIKGLEHTPEQGAKCSHCYDMRLERSAVEAQKQNCDLYSTTLAISPHKVQKKLKNYGELFALKYKVPYYARNFMKEDGFKESVKYTNTWDIYRQDYCGCWFSLYEGGQRARQMAEDFGLKKENIEKGTYTLPE